MLGTASVTRRKAASTGFTSSHCGAPVGFAWNVASGWNVRPSVDVSTTTSFGT